MPSRSTRRPHRRNEEPWSPPHIARVRDATNLLMTHMNIALEAAAEERASPDAANAALKQYLAAMLANYPGPKEDKPIIAGYCAAEIDRATRGEEPHGAGQAESGVFTPKFDPISVSLTEGIQEAIRSGAITHGELEAALLKHSCGDWGDMPEEDERQNDSQIMRYETHGAGGMVMSSWEARGTKFWIITHLGRETTILLPEEY